MTDKEGNISSLIETGADISGGIAGTVLGGIVAGPVGIIIGGVSGPLITRVFKRIGSEVKNRLISNREEVRIGAAFAFAINKLNQNISEGKPIRQDDFFNESDTSRPYSEEVFEGVILNVQREYEERKVKFIGNLYANVCTNELVSREQANQLIKTSNILSYRQFCVLQLFNQTQLSHENTNSDGNKIDSLDLMSEIHDLQQKGLISIAWRYQDIDDNSRGIPVSDIQITSLGEFYCEMLSLEELDLDDLNNISQFLKTK